MDFQPVGYGYKRDYVPFWTAACSICDETLSAVARSYMCPRHVRSYIHVRVTVVVVYVAKSAHVVCVATRVLVIYVAARVVI